MKTISVVFFALVASASCSSNETAIEIDSRAAMRGTTSGTSLHSTTNLDLLNHHASPKIFDIVNPNQTVLSSFQEALTSGTDIVCESWHFKFKKCPVGFPIKTAQLVEQYSRTPCQFTVNWNYEGSDLWVNDGCRGKFHVEPEPTITGKLYPKYYVMTVMYAPPGTSSTVTYGQGTSFGSTTSTTKSWSNSRSHSVKASIGGKLFFSAGLDVSRSVTNADESTSSYDIKSTAQSDFILGGFQDVVNHDLDRIYLWLNPQVNIAITGDNVTWEMSAKDGETPLISYVNVIWLRDPTTMPSNVAMLLHAANINADDYEQILSVDPFVNGSNSIDPSRFKYQTELPYLPVGIPGQNPTPTRYAITKAFNMISSDRSSISYSVETSKSGGVDFLSFLKVNLSVSDKMTWTHTSQFSTSSGSSLSAAATIMQPAYGYIGSTTLRVYLDTVFNTFLFAL